MSRIDLAQADTATPDPILTDPAAISDPSALLASLRDIHLPQQTGSELSPGWTLLALGTLLLFVMLGVYLARKHRAADWRQAAQQEMSLIRQQMPHVSDNDTVAACSRLLRRVSLALAPRTEVASMTGKPWLELLDTLHNSHEFSNGPGRVLADQPYRRPHKPGGRDSAPGSGQQNATLELVSLVDNFVNQAGQ